ncbi:MAG: major capsid protein, partial [Sporomusa sp.]
MKSIFELVTSQAIATYWSEVHSNSIPYLGEALFPADKKLGLDLSWIKGNKGLPVALKPSNFDAKAPVRDRIAVSKIDTEMPFFRESMTIKEKDRQELLKLQSANPAYYQTLLKQIFDDAGTLVDGALVQPERMRMGLLLGGKINISAERLDYTYDFDIDGSYASSNTLTLSGTDMWSDHDNS